MEGKVISSRKNVGVNTKSLLCRLSACETVVVGVKILGDLLYLLPPSKLGVK